MLFQLSLYCLGFLKWHGQIFEPSKKFRVKVLDFTGCLIPTCILLPLTFLFFYALWHKESFVKFVIKKLNVRLFGKILAKIFLSVSSKNLSNFKLHHFFWNRSRQKTNQNVIFFFKNYMNFILIFSIWFTAWNWTSIERINDRSLKNCNYKVRILNE